MNLISKWKDILDIIREDTHVNLIATAVTPWNALSIDALLAYLTGHGVDIHAIIVIAEHYQAGYMITESSFTNTCSIYFHLPYTSTSQNKTIDSDLNFINYYRDVFNLKLRKSPNLFYVTFNHAIPDILIACGVGAYTHRTVYVCHSEEGVGAYMGTFDKTYPILRDVHSFGELHSYIRYSFFGKTIYRLTHKTYSSLTLRDSIFGLAVNKSIIPYYREIFRQRCKYIDVGIQKKCINNSVILCTTAWERSEIQDNEDARVLEIVCSHLHQKGVKLLLKPHPRDRYFITLGKKLHCDIIDVPGASTELICEYAQPRAVISFSSTTLVNPKIFWGIPTFCLTDMLKRDKISDFYLDEIDSFKRTFGKFVKHISSCDELQIT